MLASSTRSPGCHGDAARGEPIAARNQNRDVTVVTRSAPSGDETVGLDETTSVGLLQQRKNAARHRSLESMTEF
ncbi:hypothetical protein MTO96_004880 [Rhipicephalus appendiculatus]